MFDEEKEEVEETEAADEGPEAKADEADDAADEEPDPKADEADSEPEATEPPPPPARPTRKKRTPEQKAARRALRKRRRVEARPSDRKPIVRIPKPERPRAARKERVGVVVSDAMERTITVRVERTFPHQRYGKVVRRSSTFSVHDAENAASVGDRVRIVETRPISKTKRWRLAEVLEGAR